MGWQGRARVRRHRPTAHCTHEAQGNHEAERGRLPNRRQAREPMLTAVPAMNVLAVGEMQGSAYMYHIIAWVSATPTTIRQCPPGGRRPRLPAALRQCRRPLDPVLSQPTIRKVSGMQVPQSVVYACSFLDAYFSGIRTPMASPRVGRVHWPQSRRSSMWLATPRTSW